MQLSHRRGSSRIRRHNCITKVFWPLGTQNCIVKGGKLRNWTQKSRSAVQQHAQQQFVKPKSCPSYYGGLNKNFAPAGLHFWDVWSGIQDTLLTNLLMNAGRGRCLGNDAAIDRRAVRAPIPGRLSTGLHDSGILHGRFLRKTVSDWEITSGSSTCGVH